MFLIVFCQSRCGRSTKTEFMDNHIPAVVEYVSNLNRVVTAGNIVVQALDFIWIDIFVLDFTWLHLVHDFPGVI